MVAIPQPQRPKPTIRDIVARQLARIPNPWRQWILPFRAWLVRVLVRTFSRVQGNTETEEEKLIISGGSWSVGKKCLVHVIPLCATIVLAAINLKGFFIGANFLGSTDETIQSFDQLLLQITAKLYELLIVASLTTIVLDVLRRELLFGSEGLPFGFVLAPFQFQELTYWLSPDFWHSQYALKSRVKWWKIVMLLATSTTIALFAGPSSALLMLPQSFTHWPGGGAHFTMAGGQSSLWPDRLEQLPNWCALASVNSTAEEVDNSCSTNSFRQVAQTLRGWRSKQKFFNVDVTDGLVRRHVDIVLPDLGNKNVDTWVVAPHLATCLYSEVLTNLWHNFALYGAYKARNELGPFSKYKFRDHTGSTASVKAQVPIVRVNCHRNMSETVFANKRRNAYYYPVQPEIGNTPEQPQFVTPAKNSEARFVNSSRIATVWVPPPTDNASWNSSAYLNIQFPTNGSSTRGTIMTCSVDARWAAGNIVGSLLGFWNGIQYYNATVYDEATKMNYPGEGYEFPAFQEVTSRKVHLDQKWLQDALPKLSDNNAAYTTLSSTLEALGFADGAEPRPNWREKVTRNVVEAAVAALVADGMSQTGYGENGGYKLEAVRDLLDGKGMPTARDQRDLLLSGDLDLPLLANITAEAMDPATTRLRWDIFIGGLAYSANSVAYYLALTVVFAHTLLALTHTVWCFWLRRTSGAWSSQSDILAFAINSQPTPELEGTSGGIKTLSRHGLPVRIRDVRTPPQSSQSSGASQVTQTAYASGTDYNSLQLMVGPDYLGNRSGAAKVELNAKY